MDSWKSDLQTVNQIITGNPASTWKGDFISIAGGSSRSWREAVIKWAESQGVQATNWRNALIGISNSLTTVPAQTWREALRFIRLFYEGNPPTAYALFDSDGNALFDNAGNRLFVRY